MSIGAKRARASYIPYSDGELPLVSVIVPARNEENNIKFCLESLSKSDYPRDKYEIIAVNDRSSDSTGAILDELKVKYPLKKNPLNTKSFRGQQSNKHKEYVNYITFFHLWSLSQKIFFKNFYEFL